MNSIEWIYWTLQLGYCGRDRRRYNMWGLEAQLKELRELNERYRKVLARISRGEVDLQSAMHLATAALLGPLDKRTKP